MEHFAARIDAAAATFLAATAHADGEMLVEPPSSRRVDCHISADPLALLLLMFSRRRVLDLYLRGRVLAWGRRPWMAPMLRKLLRNP